MAPPKRHVPQVWDASYAPALSPCNLVTWIHHWNFVPFSGTRSLENLNCHTRPTVVPTHPLYYPYFVSLHRCNGSCGTNSPARFKCVPSKQKAVEITVRHGLETKVVKLSNHTECTTECVIKEGNCVYPNTYDGKQCTCKCNRNTPPADIQCTPLQRLVTFTISLKYEPTLSHPRAKAVAPLALPLLWVLLKFFRGLKSIDLIWRSNTSLYSQTPISLAASLISGLLSLAVMTTQQYLWN